ncbi:MAG: tyrosine-type recombinase/integrase, partial [Shewanella sp.]|nr:tyrosine-type recombinase/integrase [Shewanella sp.]
VLMQLLHGTRIGETRKAKWQHINLVTGSWHIPATHTKTKQAHDLPLTEQVKRILTSYRQYQARQGYRGAFLFPNQRQRSCINDNKAHEWNKSVSQGQWRSHSLRKVARTVWMDLGTDYLVGELLLNHTMTRLDQAYIHTHAERLKRQALEQYHQWIDVQSCFYLTAFGTETFPRSQSQVTQAKATAQQG